MSTNTQSHHNVGGPPLKWSATTMSSLRDSGVGRWEGWGRNMCRGYLPRVCGWPATEVEGCYYVVPSGLWVARHCVGGPSTEVEGYYYVVPSGFWRGTMGRGGAGTSAGDMCQGYVGGPPQKWRAATMSSLRDSGVGRWVYGTCKHYAYEHGTKTITGRRDIGCVVSTELILRIPMRTL